MTEFDPALHRMVSEQRWFEDFVLGERFCHSEPHHDDGRVRGLPGSERRYPSGALRREYCRARGMPNLLAHGFQTLIHTAPGSGLFPFMVEESAGRLSRTVEPVPKTCVCRRHDLSALEVSELTPGRTTGVVTLRSTVFNQRGELVLEGIQKFLIRRRPASQ